MFGETELLSSLWLNLASSVILGLTIQYQDATMTRSIVFGLSPVEGALKLVMSALFAVMPR